MYTLTEMLQKRGSGQAGSLLRGSDLPEGTKTITIVVEEVRESPEGFNAPVIVVFKVPINGKTAWAVNKTNLKAIIKHFGDDPTKLLGKEIKLELISVRNPIKGEIVPS